MSYTRRHHRKTSSLTLATTEEGRWQARNDRSGTGFVRLFSRSWLRRRSWPIVAVYACLVALVSLALWLHSARRQEEIDVRRISCARRLPWYYFAGLKDPLLSTSELYVPARTSQAGQQNIGILQACSGARGWWLLDEVVSNHRTYSEQWGFEYQLDTGGNAGVWGKLVALQEKLAVQVDKSPEERLDWIFVTDIDTMILNPTLDLRVVLPPAWSNTTFMLVTNDHNGFNAGSFLMKAESRSLAFVEDVLNHPRNSLEQPWAEQSIMDKLISERDMLGTGEAVMLPQTIFNSYAGDTAFSNTLPVFGLHWPSVGFKRRSMLSTVRRIRQGQLKMSPDQLADSRSMLESLLEEFWMSRKP